MKMLFLATALAGTVLAGVPVVAQGPGGGMMMRADTNGDGVITRDEFLAQSAERFQRMDANHDGKLAGDELRGRMAERAQGGTITREAFMAEAEARFQRLDANHDGKITKDEMAALGARGGAGMAPPAGGMPGPHGHGDWFDKIDTNHDGRISREEMRAQADAHFAKLDTNHDGFVDKAELNAAHMHHRHGGMPAPGADAGQ
ncbi:EF-hand domain-containing protein [Sphingomonas sp. H39-1-10]|uniref:EF-hand domain-containing protein n=1 Tax=Sphingomonas TaxID=13687 RepID=UPI0008843693|nr:MULTISPECIES: EF-hand domain-containing protein [Sphingomonas]MDF0489782.1 EF-hand domain-containing protein [Sphingomonas pollutisoli]SDA31511.1 Ca2+-binding protein, EF-hand superfamily [Sphingomonas sp. NFR15]